MPMASRSPFRIQGRMRLARPGGALGYGGIGSSVAIKFDLYNNAGEGADSTGFYTDGAIPTIPALSMAASGVNLHSTHIMHAHITYDGTTLSLVLTDTVTGASFTASQVINIPATVGGNSAYVGFTAGTGGLSADPADPELDLYERIDPDSESSDWVFKLRRSQLQRRHADQRSAATDRWRQ